MLNQFSLFLLVSTSAALFVSRARPPSNPAEVAAGAYPYVVSVQGKGFISRRHECAGAVISPKYILTSADCAGSKSYDSDKSSVIAGSPDLKAGGSHHLIKTVHVHEDYENNPENNIALLEVSPELSLSDQWHHGIEPIALSKGEFPAGTKVSFAGWGFSIKIYTPSGIIAYKSEDYLRFADFKLISNDHCRVYHPNVTNAQICVLGHVGNGLCGGDNGGPLVFAKHDGNETISTVVGIATSKRREECDSGFPNVFTRASPFIPWINKTCGCISS